MKDCYVEHIVAKQVEKRTLLGNIFIREGEIGNGDKRNTEIAISSRQHGANMHVGTVLHLPGSL